MRHTAAYRAFMGAEGTSTSYHIPDFDDVSYFLPDDVLKDVVESPFESIGEILNAHLDVDNRIMEYARDSLVDLGYDCSDLTEGEMSSILDSITVSNTPLSPAYFLMGHDAIFVYLDFGQFSPYRSCGDLGFLQDSTCTVRGLRGSDTTSLPQASVYGLIFRVSVYDLYQYKSRSSRHSRVPQPTLRIQDFIVVTDKGDFLVNGYAVDPKVCESTMMYLEDTECVRENMGVAELVMACGMRS